VIVESGFGSLLPTSVVANLLPSGAGAKSRLINVGDQILSVDGESLVGLSLTQAQNVIKAAKSKTKVKIVLVPCQPVLEVRLRRPDVRCPLGFSVQDGVICSLLRGGLAERAGLRFGHRILEIDGVSMVAQSHDRVISALASACGVIALKTMPLTMFNLLTGQEKPEYY